MQETFDLPLLQAISDWQRGGDANQNNRRGQVLKEACASLPKKYHTCALCCFRQVALPKGEVWNLIGKDLLPEKISSWTVDIEVAKDFKGGVPPEEQGYQGTILCVHPQPGSIIVNLRELYQDPIFTEALEKNKAAITGYHEGAGRYGNNQSEVVLEVPAVTQQDIYSMGDKPLRATYNPSSTPHIWTSADIGRVQSIIAQRGAYPLKSRPNVVEPRGDAARGHEVQAREVGLMLITPMFLNPE